MSTGHIDFFQGKKVKILEMILTNEDNQLELSCKLCLDDAIYGITFYNVSRLRINNFSKPLEVYGFEVINHSQNGWEKDSKYEICDFEDDRVNFFCEYFEIHELDCA